MLAAILASASWPTARTDYSGGGASHSAATVAIFTLHELHGVLSYCTPNVHSCVVQVK